MIFNGFFCFFRSSSGRKKRFIRSICFCVARKRGIINFKPSLLFFKNLSKHVKCQTTIQTNKKLLNTKWMRLLYLMKYLKFLSIQAIRLSKENWQNFSKCYTFVLWVKRNSFDLCKSLHLSFGNYVFYNQFLWHVHRLL